MRVGVEAGEVLVDQERAGGTRDRMLTGDAVNTAARLQSAAEPGTIVVGPAVFATTKEVIEYRELPPLDLKGKAASVPAWPALRVRAQAPRRAAAASASRRRLVGRDEEFAVLEQTLHACESEGRPALVTVVGTAGVGKSRLVRELGSYVEGLPRSSTGGEAVPRVREHVVLRPRRRDQGTVRDPRGRPGRCRGREGERTVRGAVRRRRGRPAHPRARRRPTEQLVHREDLFDAWRRFLERMAARYPLVLVFEDVHWADEGCSTSSTTWPTWRKGR